MGDPPPGHDGGPVFKMCIRDRENPRRRHPTHPRKAFLLALQSRDVYKRQDKNVTIAGNVAPGRINVSCTDFIFTGDGSSTGDTTRNLLDGASLTMNNACLLYTSRGV